MKIVVKGDPQHDETVPQSSESLAKRSYPRKALVPLLTAYNREIGNDAAALANIGRLGDSTSVCVVTGQQLGLMGGPSYTILKAISCLLLARATGSIPIFWAATEDHDIGEIDHTTLLDSLSNLATFRLRFRHDGRFVEDLTLTEGHLEAIRSFCEAAGLDPCRGILPCRQGSPILRR